MQSQSSAILDDLARLMTGAMGAAQGIRDEAKSFMHAQADRVAAEFDFVRRDEFEAMSQLAKDAKAEVEALRARLAALEARLPSP
jgi:BMFP domain-containing protein YqiC